MAQTPTLLQVHLSDSSDSRFIVDASDASQESEIAGVPEPMEVEPPPVVEPVLPPGGRGSGVRRHDKGDTLGGVILPNVRMFSLHVLNSLAGR